MEIVHSIWTNASTQPPHTLEGGIGLDVVLGHSVAAFKRLARENHAAFVVLECLKPRHDGKDRVAALNAQSDGLAIHRLHKDQHAVPGPDATI